MKRNIYLMITVLLIIFIGFLGYRFLGTSRVVVDLANYPSSRVGRVMITVDGHNITNSNSISVTRGTHSLTFSDPCYEDIIEDFSTSWRSTKSFKPVPIEVSAVNAAKNILDPDEAIYTVSSAKFYGDCDWLAVFVTPLTIDLEGYAAIARYQDGKWNVITEGTALYLEANRLEAPNQLLKDLEEVIEG